MKKLIAIVMLTALIGLSVALLAVTTDLFEHKYQPGDNDSLYEDPE